MTAVGRVSFIGAGPGAADLITVRGAQRIAHANIILWSPMVADALVVRENASSNAEVVDLSRITESEVVEIYRRALRDRLVVARLHVEDPAMAGSVREQYDICRRIGLEVEIVPGVSAASTLAAGLGVELIDDKQTVVLARLDSGIKSTEDADRIAHLAKANGTMAVTMPAAKVEQLGAQLRAGGYAEDTPIVVAYKVSQSDELVLRTTLAELETDVKKQRVWRNAVFLIGQILEERKPKHARSTSLQRPAAAPDIAENETVVLPRRSPGQWVRQARATKRAAAPEAAPVTPVPAPAPPAPVSAPIPVPVEAKAPDIQTQKTTQVKKTASPEEVADAERKSTAKLAEAVKRAERARTQANPPGGGSKRPAKAKGRARRSG
ncbi:cobalt-precorrin-4 C(11)-methyltransferase [Pseudonocardiaceae bacterium YIM PH 21723]|nr:cobalt-precorrin-4 C(11)-methyltransferase [Pseudonocardiaceae bacterium YIM PH 21723]